ncbi:vitamin B12 transporter BtuB precursor [bacterium BMS3Abin05]|nr:vitamin B12 transporter BtuB precursor [bacterium BMS3Abin05]GBE28786.1 vitamin B12 transporter BtuB precursor [bacterium BMS3Bbin03]HDL78470.1 TonB-dependent receptor [Bacteroidota bacterium]HDZ12561.1 TonB-dependent receptor [Bacteroidota bacterium]
MSHRTRKQIILGLLFLMAVSFPLKAEPGRKEDFQTAVKIAGQVLNAASGEPLIGADVLVAGTNYGASTDTRGAYFIENVPVGIYTIRVQMMGFSEAEKQGVQVIEDGTARVDFKLRPKVIQFGSLIVWGDRMGKTFWENPASVQVISHKEIERSAGQNLGELLKNQPGLYVYDTGGNAGSKTISVRGSHANQVLILVDGVKLNSAQNNLVDLSSIPLGEIDYIEILKNGGSTLYGSDAIGGVINIVTRKNRQSRQKLELQAGSGSFGLRQASGGFLLKWGSVQTRVNFQRRFSLGNFPYRSLFGRRQIRGNNRFRDLNLFFQVTHASILGGKWYFSGQWYRAKRGVPGALRQLTPEAALTDRRGLFQSGWTVLLNRWESLEWTAYFQKFVQDFYSPTPWVFVPISSQYQNEAYGVDIKSRTYFSEKQTLILGGSFRVDQMTGTDRIRPLFSIGRVKRNTTGVFGLFQWELPLPDNPLFQNIFLAPGVRGDWPSDFEATSSPSFGISLNHKGPVRISLKGTWAKTFRAPTFNSLFWVEDVFARGNPNLRPERGVNREAGVEMSGRLWGDWTGSVHFFNNAVKDLIYWRRGYDGKYMPVNVKAANLSGREESVSFKSAGDYLELNWSRMYLLAINHSGERNTEGRILPFRPKHTENFSARVQGGNLFVKITYRRVSKRFTREANTKFIKGYKIIGVSTGINFLFGKLRLQLQGNVHNVMNTTYEILERYPMPGRSYQLQISVKL